MGKKFRALCVAVLLSAGIFPAAGQCLIDSSQTDPGVYPDTLPDATAGQPYSTDITFVLIPDTLGFTILNFHITSVNGLPIGLTWICNNYANGCNYDPAVNLYGCGDVSGTPLIPGSYTVYVTVVATLQVVGDQTITYPLYLSVLPAQSSNNGFSTTNGSGCAPLTVSFTNNNPGQASYLWDFGDGMQSTLENPPSHTYAVPGEYIIIQTVMPNTIPDYYLTGVTVNSIPNNYGSPLDDPDMYFIVADASWNVVHDSRPAQNGLFPPQSWGVPNILLADENYTIHVWDEDGGLFGADDDLGIITFAGHGSSGNATATVGGSSGSLNLDYYIQSTPINPIVTTDTIYVYPPQAMPVVSMSGPAGFCDGDSVILSSSEPFGNQWFKDGTILSGDTSASIVVYQSGTYSVTVTNSFGCSATAAAADSIQVFANPPNPTILISGDTLICLITGFDYQWLMDGTAVPGATNSFFIPSQGGNCAVVLITPEGCTDTSQQLLVTSVGGVHAIRGSIQLYPNPVRGWLSVDFNFSLEVQTVLRIRNMLHECVLEKTVFIPRGRSSITLTMPELSPGLYLFEMPVENSVIVRRIVLGGP